MNEKTYLSALAGLLHDIGKFALRGGEGGSRIWDAQAQADYGYKHALLTADFVEHYVPQPWRGFVLSAAGRHHRPMTLGDRIVQLADHLSAGERSDPADDLQPQQTHPQRLLSVFCLINADGGALKARGYWPLAALAMNDNAIFPTDAGGDPEDWQSYRALWDDFVAQAGSLKKAFADNGDLASYLESILLLMQRYTWCLPAAYYRTRPDVSLYDHGRMTAALAAVLADTLQDEGMLQTLVANPRVERPLASLIGGDISGVQDFIYTITSRGAAGALRGRSFYLQLLTEVVARFVLRRLGLPITNLIYAGGGNFYLLARPEDLARLADIRAELSRVLLAAHGGELYVALAGEPLRGADFFDGELSKVWGRVNEGFQALKRRRFAELGTDLARLFEPQGHGGSEEQECQVCGHEHAGTKRDDDVRKCPPCLGFEKLGEDLRQARYLVLAEIEAAPLTDGGPRPTWDRTLAALGWRAEVSRRFPASPPPGRAVAWALKDAAMADLQPAPRLAVGRKLLVNVTPTREERIKAFDEMEQEAQGIRRLGVLRMDVDNLGTLFAEGLGKAATLSRIASLSFAVSLFFEGWVEERAETMGSNQVYSIYSGGDDLFFVGSWDKIVELARVIRADLGRYAAGHPDIHASAGIALIGGKYPLYQAARDAGEAEAQAKALRWGDNRRKDALSFLGLALPWPRFGLEADCDANFDTTHGLMHFLVGIANRDGTGPQTAPKAALQKLLRQYDRFAEEEKRRREVGTELNKAGGEQILWGPWVWRSYYLLRRMARDEKESSVKADLGALAELFKPDNIGSMDWIGLAARWAELLTRSDS